MYDSKDEIKIIPLPFLRIFLVIFSLISLVGIINFPFYVNDLDNRELYILFILGGLGFFLGSLLLRTLKLKINISKKGKFKPKILYFLFIGVNFIGFLLIIVTHIKNGGITILSAGKRFQAIPLTNIFVYAGIMLTLIYIGQKLLENNRFKKRYLVFFSIQSVIILTLGMRSPLIILLGGGAIIFFTIRNDYQNKYKKIFTLKNLLGVLAVILLMSYVSSYRTSLKYDLKKYYRNMDHTYFKDKPVLKQFVPTLALFRYNQQVVIKLIEETKDNHYYLGLAASNFISAMPGKQLAARNVIGKIIGARDNPNGQPWSVTPTLQGALFVDGGRVLVFLGFFMIGFIIDFIKKITVQNKDPFYLTIYTLFVINTLMILHTGYYDLIFYIMLFIILASKFVSTRIKVEKNSS